MATSAGVEEKARITAHCLKIKMREYKTSQPEIDAMRRQPALLKMQAVA